MMKSRVKVLRRSRLEILAFALSYALTTAVTIGTILMRARGF